MSNFDKSKLFAPRLPRAEITIPDVGTITVRGLNRAEAMIVQGKKGTEETEIAILHLGLVDPELTESEVRQWHRAAPAGEIEPVSSKIAELSGMLDGQAKERYKSDGEQSVA